MGFVRQQRIIDATPQAIWNALNDIDRTPAWVVGLARAEQVTPGPMAKDSVYIDYNRLGPFLQKTTWMVTEFEPLVCLVHVSGSRVLPTTMTLGLSPADGGTRLVMIVEYAFLPQLGVVGRWLERVLMNRMLGQVIAQNQAQLAAYLRGQQPVATGIHAAVLA
jgi:carbon monoxide dehydrogenase subunit G